MIHLLKIHDFNKSILVIDAYLCFIGILTTFHHPPLFIRTTQRAMNHQILYVYIFYTVQIPYVHMPLIHVNMHRNYVNMRLIYVNENLTQIPCLTNQMKPQKGLASHSSRQLAWAYILQPFIVQWCHLHVSEITLSGMLNNRQIIKQRRMLHCLNVSSIFKGSDYQSNNSFYQ